jgi:hypothetical protein
VNKSLNMYHGTVKSTTIWHLEATEERNSTRLAPYMVAL